MILDNIHDFGTLSSVVHASSQYHQVYQGFRQKILSQVIIRDFTYSTNTEVLPLSEILPYTKVPSDTTIGWTEIQKAIQAKASQAEREEPPLISKPGQQPGLSIDQSLNLLRCRRPTASGCGDYGIYFEFNCAGCRILEHWNRADCNFIGGVEGLENWLIMVYEYMGCHMAQGLYLRARKPQH